MNRGDVVVVTVNHRLNVFGYLHLAEYGEEYRDSGTAGMVDLVTSLQWVRDNISEFGGDPNNHCRHAPEHLLPVKTRSSRSPNQST